MIYECERRLTIEASADAVWDWMADVRHLLQLNWFHTGVEASQPIRQANVVVPVRHNVFGLYRQTRLARIHTYRQYVVGWGELQDGGLDRFPHSQVFTVIPLAAQRCVVVNRLRGKLVIPAARYWFMPVYRCLAPRLMDHENRQIAAAVASRQNELAVK